MRPTAAKAALRPFQIRARSCFRLRHANLRMRRCLRQSPAPRASAPPLRRCAVQLHQQQPAAHGIMRMHRGFGSLDRQRIHDLQRRRQHSGRDDVADRLARGLAWGMRPAGSAPSSGRLHDAQRNFGRHAQRAFRSDEDASQIIARRIQRGRTEVDEFAARQAPLRAQAYASP